MQYLNFYIVFISKRDMQLQQSVGDNYNFHFPQWAQVTNPETVGGSVVF